MRTKRLLLRSTRRTLLGRAAGEGPSRWEELRDGLLTGRDRPVAPHVLLHLVDPVGFLCARMIGILFSQRVDLPHQFAIRHLGSSALRCPFALRPERRRGARRVRIRPTGRVVLRGLLLLFSKKASPFLHDNNTQSRSKEHSLGNAFESDVKRMRKARRQRSLYLPALMKPPAGDVDSGVNGDFGGSGVSRHFDLIKQTAAIKTTETALWYVLSAP